MTERPGVVRSAGPLPTPERTGMTRIGRISLVAAIAGAVFLAGAVGVFVSISGSSPPPAVLPGSQLSQPIAPSATMTQVISSLQARLRVEPHDWRSWASLGLAYVQQARITADPTYYPKAQGVLERSLRIDSADNFQAMVGMAALALARHDFSGALDWGDRARKINPYNGNVYGVIGDAEVELGHYDDAFATFQKMVNTLPNTASYARVSYARELGGDVPGAISAMKAALDAAGTAEDRAWASFQLGELYFNSGRLDQAHAEYAQGAQLSSVYVPPLAGLAKVAWARGETSRAIHDYKNVVARYPLPEYVIALGDLYAISGDKTSADQQYSLVRAEEQLFRANGVNVDLELSLFESDHGDPQAGLTTARAEWDRRHSIHVADALAWALHQNGDDRQAARYSRFALHLGTQSALFNFHAGMIQLALGNRDTARTSLARALAINPHFSILYAHEAAATLAKLGRS
jgi:tetratricopeptide (TPR) repeat protein